MVQKLRKSPAIKKFEFVLLEWNLSYFLLSSRQLSRIRYRQLFSMHDKKIQFFHVKFSSFMQLWRREPARRSRKFHSFLHKQISFLLCGCAIMLLRYYQVHMREWISFEFWSSLDSYKKRPKNELL